MKKLLLFIIPFLFGFTVVIKELYTQKQIESLVARTVYDVSFWEKKSESSQAILAYRPITLSTFLRTNKRALGDRSYWACCNHENWKKLMISNSELISVAFKKYAKMAFRQINAQIKYNINYPPENSKWENAKRLSYSLDDFWMGQKYVFDKYMLTINELLKLSDDDLDYFIFTNNPDNKASSYELYEWVVSKNIISETEGRGDGFEIRKGKKISLYEGVYDSAYQMPADLLLLIKRICANNTTINPRSFLLQGKKRVMELEEIIKELGYWK
jgi:hypothetical protein